MHWPWSIRQTAVYHSFDVEHGKAFWIMIKGNKLIRKRIQDSTAKASSDLNRFGSNYEALESSLATHLLLADWCREEWRWYLNYLEERLQAATRRAASIVMEKPPSIYESPVHHHERTHTATSMASRMASAVNRTLSRKHTNPDPGPVHSLADISPFPMRSGAPSPPGGGPPPPPIIPPRIPGSVLIEKQQFPQSEEDDFTLRNLQLVQFLDEKVNEVSPVLAANIDVLTELSAHYNSALNSDNCPEELKKGCRVSFRRFEKRIKGITTDLERQRSRTQILLGLLSNRKTMIYDLSNERTLETSRIYAKRAQLSTDRMEEVTGAMFEIARKTQQDTVSMKIITLVTLFFLPGTFISTIMSTDIIRFQDNEKEYQWGALNWYLMVTIPFMVATFLAWYGFDFKAARNEKQVKARKLDIEKQESGFP